ncbi:MAG TPA: TraB/GumN family protein [Vicinamibacterales bacterium]|nr:TraB/GumN family protein [Vicinamibacterales bacterium]
MRKLVGQLSCAALLTATAAGAQAPAKHFLWSVSAPGAPPSYLMGSFHALTADYYPLSPRIEQAFAASKVLIVEADVDEMTNPATLMSLMGKAMLPDGQTLDQVIAADLHAKVMEHADKAGLPRAALQRLKPWMVAMALTAPVMQAAGFKAEHGVDRHFFDRAKKAGTERRALETAAFQFDRMDEMRPSQQEAMLRATLDDLASHTSNIETMAKAWVRGDTLALEKLLLTEMKSSPDLYTRLLVERNATWVESVETCLEQQTSCFVVVGAAHLVGPDSLVAMLRKKGYTVEQH